MRNQRNMIGRLCGCLLLVIFTCCAFLVATPRAQAVSSKPNILLIMIDDLGWMDLHCQGNDALRTPHLDRFAKQGMRFTDAYAAAPVCSPTRAALITGQSPARLQITNHIPDSPRHTPKNAKLKSAAMLDHLPLEHVTIPERLKEAGYVSGFLGKWHLCGEWRGKLGEGDVRYHPDKQGFSINVGGCALGGPPSFFDPYRIYNIPSRKEGEYLPDRLVDETITFIDSVKDKPFFACLWPYTVHYPMQAPAHLIEKYKGKEGKGFKNATYAAMIEAMDMAMGKLLGALDQRKLTDNTIVIFTSDNGPFGGVGDARPLRGDKGSLWEGGIRVPLIVRWPGVTKAGTVSDVPVVSMDYMPTMLEAAGLKPIVGTPLDGESLVPVLKGTGKLKRDAIYFHYPNYAWHRGNRLGSAIRSGDYKLIERFDDGSVQLFNLRTDLGEKKNLAKEKPVLAQQLKTRLHSWRKQVKASMPTPMPAPAK